MTHFVALAPAEVPLSSAEVSAWELQASPYPHQLICLPRAEARQHRVSQLRHWVAVEFSLEQEGMAVWNVAWA